MAVMWWIPSRRMLNSFPLVRRLIPALCALALLATGCGSGSSTSGGLKTVDVALDFVPNAVHAPLYEAVRTGADRRHGIRIHIVEPGSSPDSLKALLTRRADIGVLDIQDLGIARLKGRDVVGIAALVQKPLGALVSLPDISRPRDLEGKTVGVSGLPSDPAFVDAIVRHDGGDPSQVKQVTIGFSAVTRILSGRVDAAPVFWNAEGVVLEQRSLDTREFRVDDYGAPPYPEVVLVTSEQTLRRKRAALRNALLAIANGIQTVRANPDTAARRIADAAGTKD